MGSIYDTRGEFMGYFGRSSIAQRPEFPRPPADLAQVDQIPSEKAASFLAKWRQYLSLYCELDHSKQTAVGETSECCGI